VLGDESGVTDPAVGCLDVTDPDDLTWRSEMSVAGAPYTLVEEHHCTPSLRVVDLVLARGEMVAIRARVATRRRRCRADRATWTQRTPR